MSDNIIQLNEDLIKHDLKNLVRSSVEETLNALLDKEADELVNAGKYERSGERQGYSSGHYKRNFQTTAGEVELNVPKLKGVPFETAIIERYRRRESSVEEALIEMYLAGVSVRRVEDITEALWGTKVSPGTISSLNKKAYEHIEQWRTRPLTGKYPYVYVDGVYLKRSWGGEIQNVSVLVAIGVNEDGCREIIGAAEGMKEDKESWRSFFVWLKGRGLSGIRLIIGDKNLGMLETIPEVFPDARYQRCTVHFYRNIFSVTPRNKMKSVAMDDGIRQYVQISGDRFKFCVNSKTDISFMNSCKFYSFSQYNVNSVLSEIIYLRESLLLILHIYFCRKSFLFTVLFFYSFKFLESYCRITTDSGSVDICNVKYIIFIGTLPYTFFQHKCSNSFSLVCISNSNKLNITCGWRVV